ncbi:hypothetical protein BC629DRAFT_1621223, partial [Irpex lacteus]
SGGKFFSSLSIPVQVFWTTCVANVFFPYLGLVISKSIAMGAVSAAFHLRSISLMLWGHLCPLCLCVFRIVGAR